MDTVTIPDIAPLKQKLFATWTDGDYGIIARGMERRATEMLGALPIEPGERVLDIACGSGQWTIPAARRGARVTGVDIAENWLAQARKRAAQEGLDVRLDVGDAEELPYEDGSFDVVLSLIGAMFAPRPARVAAEMLRVCRPGGRIVMTNWTPEGFVGAMFKLVGRHVPPPDMPSPLLWGTEEAVRERFAAGVTGLETARKTMRFVYPMTPEEVAAHYFRHFGPTKRAAAALDDDRRAAFLADFTAHWRDHNVAGDGTTMVDAEVLEAIAVRA